MFLALVCVARASVPADLEWLGSLPGVSLSVNSHDDEGDKLVYVVTGDPEAVMSRIRSTLQKKGWAIGQNTSAAVGPVAAYDLYATRVGKTLHFALATGTLVVTLGSSSGSGAEVHVQATDQDTGHGGGNVVVNANNVRARYNCGGHSVVVNGNNNQLTLGGQGRNLVLNGNNNAITVQDGVGRITLNGNNNVVHLSETARKPRPAITDNGSGNSVQP